MADAANSKSVASNGVEVQVLSPAPLPETNLDHMAKIKGSSFDDRLSAAAQAKKAELEKFRAKSGANDPAFAERQAERQAISRAREARAAEREAARRARLAREAADKAAREAALQAERAAIDAELAEQVTRAAAREAVLQGERKAARDARYAARKARSRK